MVGKDVQCPQIAGPRPRRAPTTPEKLSACAHLDPKPILSPLADFLSSFWFCVPGLNNLNGLPKSNSVYVRVCFLHERQVDCRLVQDGVLLDDPDEDSVPELMSDSFPKKKSSSPILNYSSSASGLRRSL